ncbi:MAG TPA: fibronectin type III domain-containing protein [Vicinamibacterales bacterium]|nr:fibronectin type III domain-containing protein [Vicinamibacterales bacterium]
MLFASSIYGRSFGSGALAITTNWSRVSTGERIEADVVFNTAYSWNSYDGPLRSTASGDPLVDLHRVALHEFGHVLGLNHPDQFGQSVPAIMNSGIGDVDRLQADDIAGVAALYGGGGGTASTVPDAPGALTTSASGSTVLLSWKAPTSGGPPAVYVIEAGSAPRLANLASFSTGSTATSYSAGGVGAGTYYVRVRAANAAGTGPASNESMLIVGGGTCASAPGAPAGFTASASGSTVTLRWNAASGSPTTYVVEAGSAPGLNNLANSDLGSPATSYVAPGVARGAYYVRMRARNECGTGPASNEVLLVVP